MEETWIIEETRSVDLKDARLNARLREVLKQLGDRPGASIPAACGGHADMTAAYRLFDNPNATFERILTPHAQSTRQRMAAQPTVLLVQDTTEINVTRPTQQVQGAGPLDEGSRRGLFLHLLHAFTPEGTPLGTVVGLPWAREEGPKASLSRAQRAAMAFEDKESQRWVKTLALAQEQAVHCPQTQIISLCDSEADIYEFLGAAQAQPRRTDWIVRACQDRALQPEPGDKEPAEPLHAQVLKQPVLLTHTVSVRARKAKLGCETRGRRQSRQSRQAHVEVRSACVNLRPPWRPNHKLPPIEINVVLVREVQAPDGEEPIEWLLLTSLPVAEPDQARQVIQYYCTRWMIEILFRVLKSGCQIEKRRFECIDRLLSCLAVYLIIAWRTLYVCRLGRACPQISCQILFDPAEWKSVWKVLRQTDPPPQPPTLGQMIEMVAELGGYIKRKNSPPGPQTLWIGLQRTHDFAICWNLFGPESGTHNV